MAGEGHTYDGFISYSHQADDLLAPRLQSALQRFAKPWWKRRAVRIFRDESSLSANPHLWSSITEALDSSGWFVLLLSPDAASSKWVNDEIAYWVEHRDPARILPVVTGGTFGWADGDVTGDAVPDALRGVFAEEPRWVDVRWAKDHDQLDLKDPRFAGVVADVASAIRGIPKDDLASEEVRQHRRTVRTAWTAGAVVVLLGGATTVGAIVAVNQSNDAREQRDEAERQAEIAQQERDTAQTERDRADEQARLAEDNASRALREAAVARSGELAAASASTLDADVELAGLLAALSIISLPEDVTPSVESMRALRVAEREHRLLLRVPTGSGTALQRVEVSPDGATAIYLNGPGHMLAAIDLATGDELWSRLFDDPVFPVELAISPDGSTIVVMTWDLAARAPAVQVLSAADGSWIETLPPPCQMRDFETWAKRPFSPDGSVFVYHTGSGDCFDDPDAGWASFVDTESWSEVARLQVPGATEVAGFARAADRLIVTDPLNGRVEARSYPDLEVLQSFEGTAGAISPDGGRVAVLAPENGRYAIYDVATGDLLGYVEGQNQFTWAAMFSPDGQALAVLTEGHDIVVDGHDGSMLLEFGSLETTEDAAFLPDGSALVTVARSSSTLKLWALGPGGAGTAVRVGSTGLPVDHVNPDRIIDGPRAAIHAFVPTGPDRPPRAALHVVDERTGETVASVEAIAAGQLPDGRFVIVPGEDASRPDGQPDTLGTGLAVWDPESGGITTISECRVFVSDVDDITAGPVTCPDGEPPFAMHLPGRPWILVSPDGTKVAASAQSAAGPVPIRLIRVWDADSFTELLTIEVSADSDLVALGDEWLVTTNGIAWAPTVHSLDDGEVLAAFDGLIVPGGPEIQAHAPAKLLPDGRHLVAHNDVDIVVLDTTDWTMVARWEAHDARIRGVAPSPAGVRLASSASDGTVRIWDLSDIVGGEAPDPGWVPPVVDEIPTDVVSDMRWIAPDLLGLVTTEGTWTTVTLDPVELVRDVVSRLTRSFTERECGTFRIAPCPTLDELRRS